MGSETTEIEIHFCPSACQKRRLIENRLPRLEIQDFAVQADFVEFPSEIVWKPELEE